jgi:uncharacterized protein
MLVLFGFGFAHLYLIWFGDILGHYALAGAIAFFFAGLNAVRLFAMGAALLVGTLIWNALPLLATIESASSNSPEARAFWTAMSKGFGTPPSAYVQAEIAAMKGSWADNIQWRWTHQPGILAFFKLGGLETVTAMVFGMAAYRSGMLTGAWPRERYRRWAAVCLGIALPAYALIGLATLQHGFDQRWVYFGSIVGTAPFRIVATFGYAALILLLASRAGWLASRLAAVGRAAFTNYLGTSLVVTAVFYGWGLGQFGEWDRAAIYVVPPLVWLLMLAWSKPWLERFRYGPLEWLWRSLSRLELQPMRRRTEALAGG